MSTEDNNTPSTINSGRLIFFCGKMGAGKSTESRRVARAINAIRISEDEWLSTLYPNQIASLDDYLKFSAQLKPLLETHVPDILTTGISVVLDFPANTVAQRRWLLSLAAACKADHELIYLRASDALCLQQIARRRVEQPGRNAFDTEAMFNAVSRYFKEPTDNEGLNIRLLERNE